MTPPVLDASAWLAYFNGEPEADQVRSVVEGEESLTPTVVVAELASRFARDKKERELPQALAFVRAHSTIVDLDFEAAKLAGALKWQVRKLKPGFGLADAMIYAAAVLCKTKVITKDPDFSGLDHVEFLK